MILEGLVTTVDDSGRANLAPMGPRLVDGFRRFLLRPFRDSTTYRNLKAHGEGVLHVTDDVHLIARAAVGRVDDVATRPAASVRGRVLEDCCRYYEFRVVATDDRGERAGFDAETVAEGRVRDFLGFNRAKHMVLEAAILATRVGFLPLDGLVSDLERHREILLKTGGPREVDAFRLLLDAMRPVALGRGLTHFPELP